MIERSVLLPCEPERAFVLFTERAGEWWPAERRHTHDPDSAIIVEMAGRFYERARDGTEVELGIVRHFEPPTRLVLDWFPGTGPLAPTRVEVRFEAHGEGTRVTVLHSAGDAEIDRYRANAARYDASWQLVLSAWEARVREN